MMSMKKAPNRRALSLRSRRSLTGIAFLSPWILGILLFFISPLFLSLRFSFYSMTVNSKGYVLNFAGLQNFKDALFVDTNYLPYLTESLEQVLPDVAIILVFSLFVALLLKGKFHGSGLAKAIFFLPGIMASGLFMSLQSSFSSSINASVDATMQNSQQVISVLKSVNLTDYLEQSGIPSAVIKFITGPIDKIYSIMTNSGIQIFIFLAGLNSISPALYEAAQIESATSWETFWKITFPMIMPMILVNAIYSIVDSFTSISNKTMNYVYNIAFSNFNFGLSSAMCWMYFVCLGIIMAVIAWLISRRIFYYT